MELIAYLDGLIINAVTTVYHALSFNSAEFTPARIDQWVSNSTTAATIRSALSVFGLGMSVLFFVLLIMIRSQKKALKAGGVSPAIEGATSSVAAVPVGGALRERWNEILMHLESNRENDWRQAVVEADKLMDDALGRSGFPGDSFGDRLTNIQPGMLVSLDGLWWAHRIRNRIAHEIDYFLRYTEARQAISYFQSALEELQLI